jgi:F-type H+-transporting ATPase subunit c
MPGLASIGAGLVAIGAGLGVGLLAASALQGIARQPEATPKIQVNMLIAAALVEGVALFCAVICFLAK